MSIIDKIKNYILEVPEIFPVYFARHLWTLFIIGAVVTLAVGIFLFYQNGYTVVNNTYDVFVAVRKINQTLYSDALEFIGSQEDGVSSGLSRNPFIR